MADPDYINDGRPDGAILGQTSSDLVGFFGTSPVAQQTLTSLATNATIATIRTSVREIIAALQASGLCG